MNPGNRKSVRNTEKGVVLSDSFLTILTIAREVRKVEIELLNPQYSNNSDGEYKP